MKETKPNHQMLERLIYIHKRIKAGKYPNCTFLSKKLECSIPTINRDIEFLRDRFLAPIEYDSAKKGYYYTQEYNMPLNSISAKNLIALSSAKILLSNYKGTPIYDDLCNVINLMTFSEIRGNTDFIDRIAVPPALPIIIDETIWNTIYSAMKNNSIIEFDYNGRHNTETTHRRVRPYQILLDDGLCFLFGFCELRNAERLFCLSRIKNLIITDDNFTLPQDYEFSSRCGGGKFGIFISTAIRKYKIRFYGQARQYVKEKTWADDQKITDYDDKGFTEITFSSSQDDIIMRWILAQGADALPLEPKVFADDWKNQIRWMAERAGIL
ncbi:WYL domain-containing protein [Treponema denticola]|uniref:helix-turn-helix transcriptional regulator n=1 Tax=Treponema denticola TaxID=158 RepID=UPI0020A5F26E|nr:WYL domain-containing protein [Treponema denticola]UTC98844.1 WYL domain-containing protein [Treponema denticola]